MKAMFYLDGELPAQQINQLQEALCGIVEADTPLLVELLIVSEEEIQTLNREQRKIDKVTDVLSFPSMEEIFGKELLASEHGEELDEEGRLYLGSVVVCEKRAREQAEEYGHGYERELNYLFVHGILHCLGYDHESECDKVEMRAQEERIMQKMKLTRD